MIACRSSQRTWCTSASRNANEKRLCKSDGDEGLKYHRGGSEMGRSIDESALKRYAEELQ